jgi:hypothetical protein
MKQSYKISWDKHTVEITKEDGKYILWMHNKSIDEHLYITLALQEYLELIALMEQIT